VCAASSTKLALEQRRDWYRHYERQIGDKPTFITQCRELTAPRAAFDWIAAVPMGFQIPHGLPLFGALCARMIALLVPSSARR
jgi:hypothetical protein